MKEKVFLGSLFLSFICVLVNDIKSLSRGNERIVQIKEQQHKEGKGPISFFVGSLNHIVRRLDLGLRVPSKDLFKLGLRSRVDVVDNDADNNQHIGNWVQAVDLYLWMTKKKQELKTVA